MTNLNTNFWNKKCGNTYIYIYYIIKNINEENENQKGEVDFKIIIELIITDM